MILWFCISPGSRDPVFTFCICLFMTEFYQDFLVLLCRLPVTLFDWDKPVLIWKTWCLKNNKFSWTPPLSRVISHKIFANRSLGRLKSLLKSKFVILHFTLFPPLNIQNLNISWPLSHQPTCPSSSSLPIRTGSSRIVPLINITVTCVMNLSHQCAPENSWNVCDLLWWSSCRFLIFYGKFLNNNNNNNKSKMNNVFGSATFFIRLYTWVIWVYCFFYSHYFTQC